MDKVYVGKVVSTHGIKGEIRILSNFEYKNKVFVPGQSILIGDQEYVIECYRVHKQFDMVTLVGYHNINDVLFLLQKKVYVDREKLVFSDHEVLDSELISYSILTKEGKRGIIKEIFWASPSNKILRVMFDHEVLLPFFSPMILKIDHERKEIIVSLLKGL